MTSSITASPVRQDSSPSKRTPYLVRHPEFFTLGLIVILFAVVAVINPMFFQPGSLFDVLRAATRSAIFALGILVVLASGGLDVSFTAIAALVMYGLTKLALMFYPEAPFALILVAGAGGGLLLGLMNGWLVKKLAAPSLVVTIGTQFLIRGFLLAFIGTEFFMNIPPSMLAVGQANIVSFQNNQGLQTALPYTTLAIPVLALLTWWLLNKTMMGRAVYAMGGSPAIAERLGYNLTRVYLFVFGYAGLLAGIAGIIHVSSTRIANPFDIVGTELDVIAAVILGGARITGGSGTVTGTLLGVLLVTLINSVLITLGIPTTWQKVIVGAFILMAGLLFSLRSKR